MTYKVWMKTLGAAVLLVMGLSACAPLLVGGTAVTTALVVSDRRTSGEQLEDNVIELKIASEIRQQFPQFDGIRVNATSYAGVVLLTGDVPTPEDRQLAEKTVSQVEKVQRVVNRLRVGDITPFSVRSNDTWLTSKVRTNLINTKDVPSRTITIVVERGTVYLMGRVTQSEALLAAKVIAELNGINQVITLFDVVTPEQIAAAASARTDAPPPAAQTTTTIPGTNVQTMAVP